MWQLHFLYSITCISYWVKIYNNTSHYFLEYYLSDGVNTTGWVSTLPVNFTISKSGYGYVKAMARLKRSVYSSIVIVRTYKPEYFEIN